MRDTCVIRVLCNPDKLRLVQVRCVCAVVLQAGGVDDGVED